MAAQNQEDWVVPQGQFIGSAGMVFVDQTAADIYFNNYWRTNGLNSRIALVCTSWGMSMLYIQAGQRGGPPQWLPDPLLLGLIVVQDHGVQPPNGVQMVPATIQAVQAGAPGLHMVNNQLVGGLRLPWHRRVTVRRQDDGSLHYHQPKRRREHQEHVVPVIRPDGTHRQFNTLVYGSQVSSYRRAERD